MGESEEWNDIERDRIEGRLPSEPVTDNEISLLPGGRPYNEIFQIQITSPATDNLEFRGPAGQVRIDVAGTAKLIVNGRLVQNPPISRVEVQIGENNPFNNATPTSAGTWATWSYSGNATYEGEQKITARGFLGSEDEPSEPALRIIRVTFEKPPQPQTPTPTPTDPIRLILYWTRLEPRPHSANFARGLRAEIADALWFLTRQWQMGEFIGHDGGSIAHGEIKSSSTQLARYAPYGSRPGGLQQAVARFDNNSPLEMSIERERISPSLKIRVQMGQNFERMLSKEGGVTFNRYLNIFRTAYPLDSPLPEEQAARRYFDFMKGRVMDGYKFKKQLESSLASRPPGIPASVSRSINQAHMQKMLAIAKKFYNWYTTIYNEPSENDPNCWVKERLEYNFSVSAPSFNDQRKRETVLVAPEYSEGSLDWHSFLVDPNASLDPALETDTQQPKVSAFLPANVKFKGMPNKRWWDFEDETISFGSVEADKRDIAKMIVTDFALRSGNDWFVIPLPIKVGSMARINSLIVTDVFGERFLIKSAEDNVIEEGEKGWSMFKLSYVSAPQNQQQKQQPYRVADFLFLPPSLGPSLESPEIEKVNFIRDEMANMVWAIEQTYESDLGDPISGYESNIADSTKSREEHAAEKKEVVVEGGEQPHKSAKIKYTMQTHVPINWIPFLPVPILGSNHAVDLQLAQMLKPGVDIIPKSRLLKPQDKNNIEYRIKEEEVPRAGVFVSRRFQRTRWIDGSTYLWIGRRKNVGHGEGSSGLRFDVIEEIK
jgi:hypothetical protein